MRAQALCAALCLPCLALLLWSLYRERVGWRRVSKPLASLTFLASALLAGAPFEAAAWAYAGLGLSFVGDLLLLGEDRRALAGGLAAFLGGHLCYLAWVLPGLPWAALAPWSALLALPLLGAGAWILRAAWPRLGGAPADPADPGAGEGSSAPREAASAWRGLRVPALIYFGALGFLTWAALAEWLGARPAAPASALRGLGLLAFFASDLAVARHRLVTPGFGNKAWGLPTYYLAQHLLALSLGVAARA